MPLRSHIRALRVEREDETAAGVRDILRQPFSDAGASGRPSPRGSVGTRRKRMVLSRDGDVPPTMRVSLAHRLWRIMECGGSDAALHARGACFARGAGAFARQGMAARSRSAGCQSCVEPQHSKGGEAQGCITGGCQNGRSLCDRAGSGL